MDHLHNLSIGLFNYESAHGALLPAASFGSAPVATDLHGWQTHLLPFVEQLPLYMAIDLKRPWLDPVNEPHFRIPIEVYLDSRHNERIGSTGLALTHYSANSHVLTTAPLALADVTDGTTHTIFAGEIPANFPPWGQPRNVRDPIIGLHTSTHSFGGPSVDRSTQFSFLDGTVRSLNPDIGPAVLKALATPSGGDSAVAP